MKNHCLIAILLTFCTVVTYGFLTYMTANPSSAAFKDVPGSHIYNTAISFVQSEGIVSGYPDGTYQPSRILNRAEFTKIIIESRFDKKSIDNCVNDGGFYKKALFSDVEPGVWFEKYVCVAKAENIIGGYPDGTFRPVQTINFAEAAKILVGSYGFKVGTGDPWFKPFLVKLQILKAVPSSLAGIPDIVQRGIKPLSRGEMAEMIYRLRGVKSSVKSSDGSFAINIPESSLPSGVELDDIKIKLLEGEDKPVEEVNGAPMLFYELEPDGLSFDEAVNFDIEVPTLGNAIPLVFIVSGDNFEMLPNPEIAIDQGKQIASLSGQLSHFSTLAVGYPLVFQEKITTPGTTGQGGRVAVSVEVSRTDFPNAFRYKKTGSTISVLDPWRILNGEFVDIMGTLEPRSVAISRRIRLDGAETFRANANFKAKEVAFDSRIQFKAELEWDVAQDGKTTRKSSTVRLTTNRFSITPIPGADTNFEVGLEEEKKTASAPVIGAVKPACMDSTDNDGDGSTDFPADPGCQSSVDNDEANPACSNGIDDDGDGQVDLADTGCGLDPRGESETNVECNDGIDNDGDGQIDLSDTGCSNSTDDSEFTSASIACNDGIDNDGDGNTDFPADLECLNADDNSETGAKRAPECSDGKDNDGDGLTDFPADPECDNGADDREKLDSQCLDGKDNDGDGKVDFPADPGCSSATDNLELDKAACEDGVDNDSDGKIDFPADDGCANATDNDEKDPDIEFSIASSSGDEGITPANVQVKLSSVAANNATVNYAVTGGTATGGGADYTLAAGTATVLAGQTTTNISIALVDDVSTEGAETIVITLSGPTKATLGAKSVHTFTINDNDTPPVMQFLTTTSSGGEGTTPANVIVSLSNTFGANSTANYTVGGTATGGGTDYTLAAGTVTVTAGTTTKNISIPIVDDAITEAGETIVLTLSGPTNATLGANTVHTFTINDNDVPPSIEFNIASSSGDESTSPNIQVKLSHTFGLDSSATYTVTGTATGSGTDYTLANGIVSVLNGTTTKNISIPINDDKLDEPAETVILTLSAPTNATLGGKTVHTYTINDNDIKPIMLFTSAVNNGNESVTAASIQVELNDGVLTTTYDLPVSANYTITGGGTATGGGVDYTLANGTITFTPGESTKNINFTVVDDGITEANETIEFTLSGCVNCSLGMNSQVFYTIIDND